MRYAADDDTYADAHAKANAYTNADTDAYADADTDAYEEGE